MEEKLNRDEKTLADIIEAARKLFTQYGLKKTTMDDVARAAGKGKSSLYYYFPGKNELFEAVIEDELKNLLRETRQAINARQSARDKLRAYLLTRLKMKEKMHNLGQVVHDDIFDHYKEICRIKAQFEQTQVEFIQEIIRGGVQLGEFRELSNDQVGFFSNWISASFSGLDLGGPSCSQLTETEESCSRLIELILYGIGK